MKNNFLKFHDTKTNSIVYINKAEIAVIDTDDSKVPGRNVSRVYFLDTVDVSNFCVNETVEKIYTNCELEDFIRLHNYPSNHAILVNVNAIAILDSENTNGNSNTRIYLKNSANLNSFIVYESPDKINKMIEGDKNE